MRSTLSTQTLKSRSSLLPMWWYREALRMPSAAASSRVDAPA
jgi:hypothetical protein